MKLIVWFCLVVMSSSALAQRELTSGPVFGIYDKETIRRKVSLESSRTAAWQDVQGSGAYLLGQSRTTLLAAGVAAELADYALPFNLANDGWASSGVFPRRWTNVSSVRVHEDANQGMLPWPSSAASFGEWRTGDSLSWRRDKGVGIYLGVGVGVISVGPFGTGLSAGPRVTLAGSFQVHLEKTAHNQLYVEVRPGRVKTAAILGYAIIAYGEGGVRTESYRDGHSFYLDPNTELGQRAFRLAMQGRLAEVSDLIAADPHDTNRPGATLNLTRRVRYGEWALSTPLITLFSLARRQGASRSDWNRENADGTYDEGHEVDVMRERSSRVLRRYDSEVRGVRFVQDKAGRTLVSWRWEWENTLAGPVRLQNALARLRARLDCGDHCGFGSRNVPGTRAGYVRADATWQVDLEVLRDVTRGQRALSGAHARIDRCLVAIGVAREEHGGDKAAFEKAIIDRRDCLRELARELLNIQRPLATLFAGARSCVPVSFRVGGQYLQRWVNESEVCP